MELKWEVTKSQIFVCRHFFPKPDFLRKACNPLSKEQSLPTGYDDGPIGGLFREVIIRTEVPLTFWGLRVIFMWETLGNK